VFYLHPGMHFGNSMPPFVKKFVLPLLRDGSTQETRQSEPISN
jgi:hypothetical protein